jgi:hypothetical protein
MKKWLVQFADDGEVWEQVSAKTAEEAAMKFVNDSRDSDEFTNYEISVIELVPIKMYARPTFHVGRM